MEKEDYLDKSWEKNLKKLNKLRKKPENQTKIEIETKTIKVKQKKVIEINSVFRDFHISLTESVAVQRVVIQKIKLLSRFFRRDSSFKEKYAYEYGEYKALGKFYNKLKGRNENYPIYNFYPLN